jgi:hypothetical protein
MSIELNGSMYTMDDAFAYGAALHEANGNKGVISIRPENGSLVVTIVEALGVTA